MNNQKATFHIDAESGVLFVGTKQCGYEWSNEGMFTWVNGERKAVSFDHCEVPLFDIAIIAHGRWIPINTIHGLRFQCDQCNHYVDAGTDRNYCPNCGAKMDGDGNG